MQFTLFQIIKLELAISDKMSLEQWQEYIFSFFLIKLYFYFTIKNGQIICKWSNYVKYIYVSFAALIIVIIHFYK